ncbi:MAG: hypothetical protein AAGJ37_13425 [Pseudomonadota bacterium]
MSDKKFDTTMRIDAYRKQLLTQAVLEISMKRGELIKITDVVRHLIDNYLDDATRDMSEEVKN